MKKFLWKAALLKSGANGFEKKACVETVAIMKKAKVVGLLQQTVSAVETLDMLPIYAQKIMIQKTQVLMIPTRRKVDMKMMTKMMTTPAKLSCLVEFSTYVLYDTLLLLQNSKTFTVTFKYDYAYLSH